MAEAKRKRTLLSPLVLRTDIRYVAAVRLTPDSREAGGEPAVSNKTFFNLKIHSFYTYSRVTFFLLGSQALASFFLYLNLCKF